MRLTFLLFVALLPVVASAQRGRPVAERGDLALVASVPGIDVLRLDPAVGGIGLRYRVADRTVLGASIRLRYETQDQDVGGRAGEVVRRSVGLTLWNENHVGRRLGPVSPFVGVGVTAAVGEERVEVEASNCGASPGCPTPPDGYRDRSASVSAGVGALLGAEVRVARGVTLGAAYVLGVEVSRFRFERTLGDVTDDDGQGSALRAGAGVTDLHVSVYF